MSYIGGEGLGWGVRARRRKGEGGKGTRRWVGLGKRLDLDARHRNRT